MCVCVRGGGGGVGSNIRNEGPPNSIRPEGAKCSSW